jgi:hypothetical protein
MKKPIATHIAFAKKITHLMDLRFNMGGVKFGIDPLLDLIPGLGNIVATATSFYLFWIAIQLNVPKWVYGRMLWNIVVDFLFGVVPYVGVIFDVFYRANVRNYMLIEKYFDPKIIEGEIVDG